MRSLAPARALGRARRATTGRLQHGQSLVEFALVAPIVLLLLLITIDFGRVFMGWVQLNTMARVAANYAALHEDTWPPSTATQLAERAQYEALIDSSKSTIDCAPVKPGGHYPDPAFGVSRDPGDMVSVTLQCNFTLVAPFVQAVLPNPVVVTSTSRFPITKGCLSSCEDTGGGGPATPPPALDNCRVVPTMTNLSVSGARNLWVAAGFPAGNFTAPADSEARTVKTQSLSQPPGADPCSAGKAFVFSSVSVTIVDLVTPKPTPTCEYVPDLRGMTVSDARAAWLAARFTGAFAPATGQDANIVDTQTSNPTSLPGDCIEPAATMDVTYVDPPGPPPALPCRVPSLVNTPSSSAASVWQTAGFTPGNLTFKHPNQLPYTIKTQSLVGNTYWPCTSTMDVDK